MPSAAPADRRRVGFGTGHGHHGEIVQGVFDVTSELSAHGLLTLPCPLFSSRVQFTPNSSGKITAFDATRARGSPHAKTITAAELTCSFIGSADCGGDLRVDSNIPKGKGCGSRCRCDTRRRRLGKGGTFGHRDRPHSSAG
jgi:uncharacterized protein involved in propanediol utilization